MRNATQRLVEVLVEDLSHYHSLTEDALRRKDMDAFMFHGRQFHITADRILHHTGSDPRERYQ